MKRSTEKLGDLSPLVLKRRIEKLRRDLAVAQMRLPEAQAKDLQSHQWSERCWFEARSELIQLRPKLAVLSEQINKDYPSSISVMLLDITIDFILRRDKSTERAMYKEREILSSRCISLEGFLGLKPYASDPIPEPHENPYSKSGPSNFHLEPAQRYLDHVKAELQRHLDALGGDTARLERLEAIQARVLRKERELAARLRLTFTPTGQCPYCGQPLGNDPHLDHIYPVSKGGLSVSTNLVFACLQCNQRKSDMTLAAFLKAYNLDRQEAETRLSQLGKHF